MSVKTFKVRVTQWVDVTLDETKFTPEFFGEFGSTIAPWDTIEEHVEHLAWVQASGLEDLSGKADPFVEGYGPVKDFGITASITDTETEIE